VKIIPIPSIVPDGLIVGESGEEQKLLTLDFQNGSAPKCAIATLSFHHRAVLRKSQATLIISLNLGFKERMKRRPAVEGTISELTRAHGTRRSRYRGLNKVRLQASFTGGSGQPEAPGARLGHSGKASSKSNCGLLKHPGPRTVLFQDEMCTAGYSRRF
jgi:hypothetical protein